MAAKQTIRAAVVCHKGCVRSNNEDNFFFNGNYLPLRGMNQGAVMAHTFTDKCQLYGVFDGMGGGDMGEYASALAASLMQNVYLSMQGADVEKLLNDFALDANANIVASAKNGAVMGTTMAVTLLRGTECHVGNVGDSRVYLLRAHRLQQLSTDHSAVGDKVRIGHMTAEQARKSSGNNIITRYLGMPDDTRPQQLLEYHKVEIAPGDRLMICSDGLCDLLSARGIESSMCTAATPEDCASKLVLQALELGGKDNTTCIVFDMGDFAPLTAASQQPPMMNTAAVFPAEVQPVLQARPRPQPPQVPDDDTCLL